MKFETPATNNPIDQLKIVGKPVDRVDGPLKTTGTGVFSARATHRKGQRYRVKWTSPSGKRYSGAAVRSY